MSEIIEFVKYLSKLIRFFTVAKKLKRLGFIKRIDVEHFTRLSGKIIAESAYTLEELTSSIEKFRKNFPHAEKLNSSLLSPYGDVVVFESLYTIGPVRIAFWLESSVDSLPPSLLKPGCKFVRKESSSFSLVCELKEAPHA